MQSKLLIIHALSPLHAGTGQSIGAVDLPIARNRATEHPYVPGTSIKGALRDKASSIFEKDVRAVFGPEATEGVDHAGAVAFGDANILALPVRSIAGTFSWVSSPYVLSRFLRDMNDTGANLNTNITSPQNIESCFVSKNTALTVSVKEKNRVVFEDLDLQPKQSDAFDKLTKAIAELIFPNDNAWQKLFEEKFCLVSDDIFTFLSRHGTDVVTRIRLDSDSKTVVGGALWTEENLPAETVLYSNVVSAPNKGSKKTDKELFELLTKLNKTSVQFGGKATVGRGRCQLHYIGGAQ